MLRKVQLVEGDIHDVRFAKHIMEQFKIDAVIHFAASSLVGESMTNPSKYYFNNVEGSLHLLADLRLDAVAAAGYGVSRSRMADEIKSLNVKINWQEAKKAAQPVKEGDVLSFRGRGRVEVAEIRGTTKKGRISITLKRYI